MNDWNVFLHVSTACWFIQYMYGRMYSHHSLTLKFTLCDRKVNADMIKWHITDIKMTLDSLLYFTHVFLEFKSFHIQQGHIVLFLFFPPKEM